MGKRNSPMKAKVFMANVREFKKLAHVVYQEPSTTARGEVLEFSLTHSERVTQELRKRAYMTPTARDMREGFVALREIRTRRKKLGPPKVGTGKVRRVIVGKTGSRVVYG